MSPQTLRVRVARKTVEAEGIAGLTLVAADGGALPGFAAGAHVELQLSATLRRPYSLCNAPPPAGQGASHYELGVLREPASRGGSAAVHERLNEGDELEIQAPRNLFPLAEAAPLHLLLAGGIGITPLLSMAQRLAAVGAEFLLHHATRSLARTPYVQRLAQQAWADRVHHHPDDDATRRLDIAALLAASREREPGAHLYVCGPRGFMDAVLAAARSGGWPEAQLHWESFGGGEAQPSTGGAFEVQIGRGGRVIPVAADQSVVQALAAAGVEIITSCGEGVCGTCLTRVLDGLPEHHDQYLLPEEQAANDQFLPCCSRACSPRLVLDL